MPTSGNVIPEQALAIAANERRLEPGYPELRHSRSRQIVPQAHR